eukprot:5866166-Prymnesium_polylepis.1
MHESHVRAEPRTSGWARKALHVSADAVQRTWMPCAQQIGSDETSAWWSDVRSSGNAVAFRSN